MAALIDNPAEDVQLIAGDNRATAASFATIYWTWQALQAARVGVLHDLFVVAACRGSGVSRALIERCRDLCHEFGAETSSWPTYELDVR